MQAGVNLRATRRPYGRAVSRRLMIGGAALAAGAALLLPSAPAFAHQATAQATAFAHQATAPAKTAPAPAKTANKLFNAWLAGNKVAAAKVATPAAVGTIFSYVYRAPDKFAGCVGTVCRFVHTSVRVPGGLNGILMIVSGPKVAKVYQSRHLTKPSHAAKYLFKAWQQGDRYRGLEAASEATVKKLFKVKYDPNGVTHFFQGCTKEPKGYSCAYSYEGGAMFMHVRGTKAAGYAVHSIGYIAD